MRCRSPTLRAVHCVRTATLVAPRVTPPASLKRTKMWVLAGSKATAPVPVANSDLSGLLDSRSRQAALPLDTWGEWSQPRGGCRPTSRRTKIGRHFSCLQHQRFRPLWTGSILSSVAYVTGLTACGWVAFDLHHHSSTVGLVVFASFLPSLIITPFAGVFADRYDRRTMLLTMNAVGLLSTLMLAWIAWSGDQTAWPLVAVSFILGASRSPSTSMEQAMPECARVRPRLARNGHARGVARNSAACNYLEGMVGRGGIEPPTPGFSGLVVNCVDACVFASLPSARRLAQ